MSFHCLEQPSVAIPRTPETQQHQSISSVLLSVPSCPLGARQPRMSCRSHLEPRAEDWVLDSDFHWDSGHERNALVFFCAAGSCVNQWLGFGLIGVRWQCLKTFSAVMDVRREGCPWHLIGRGWEASAEHPAAPSMALCRN